MSSYALIGALAGTTVLAGIWGYQNDQRATVLDVLIAEKARTITALEADNAGLAAQIGALETELATLRQAEAQRAEQEAARNAAEVSYVDAKTYGPRCRSWIAREFGDDKTPVLTRTLTRVTDTWMKDGRLVFEVSTPSRNGRTSSIFLCVVDKAKGNLFKPSAFDAHNWRRNRS